MLLTGLLYGAALIILLLVFARVRSFKVRQAILLIASYALYLTWGVWFGAVLLASTVMNFLVGRWLKRQPTAAVLWTGLAFNLALLAIFKYIPGIAVSIPLASLQKFSHLALPLGISFWTFQAMSYLLDLYRGEELDPTFVEFALYMAFFPVTISGPICRMPEMLPQFRSAKSVSSNDIAAGLCRVATGVLMMQIAQLLGKGVLGGEGINGGFDHVTRWSGLDVLVPGVWLWLATLLRFCRLLARRHWGCKDSWVHRAGKLCPAIRLHHAVDFLDTLAHVVVVLDSRLRVPSPGGVAARSVVAKPGPHHCDDIVWLVAQRKYFVCVVGKLSRNTFSYAPAMASLAAGLEVAGSRCGLDANLVGSDHDPHQRGMDIVSRKLTTAGDSDADGDWGTGRLRRSQPSAKPVHAGCWLGHRIRSRALRN